MPYIVTNSDGSLTVTVPDSTVDTSTYSLALVGRSVSNYGQYFAQNTIRHLENFASSVAPSPGTTLEGQLWYNKTEEQLSVWEGSSWKRIGTVVGADNEKPTTYRTAGTSFFNTTTNKLEVWNDGWQDAGYAGLVTSAYSADTNIQSPTTYGTRLRTLFLRKASSNEMIPVIALVYVKSPQTNEADPTTNRGATEVPTGSGNYETIMALFSDFQFDVDSSGTNTPVAGSTVNYYSELVPGDGTGILDARTGRVAGRVLKGLNGRAEYEGSSTNTFSTLFVTTQLGSASDRVPIGYFTDIDISTSLSVGSLTVINNSSMQGDLDVTGNITSTSGVIETDDLIVNLNSTLNGNTSINGQLTVNGVNTQNLGTDAEKIESAFFDNVDTQSITVDGTATIDTLNVANISSSTDFLSTSSFGDDVDVLGGANITLDSGYVVGASTQVLGINTNAATNHYITFVDNDSTGRDIVRKDTGLVYVPSTNTITAGVFSGVATSAQYADLAEIYAADAELEPGTVVMIGGSAEVTACDTDACLDVFGVVSTDPAYLMNSKAEGVPVALQGRVPVKVIGTCSKGDRLVSSGVAGHARAIGSTAYDPRAVIGRALANKTDEGQGKVEAVIGVK
jgi:hypothetical protein